MPKKIYDGKEKNPKEWVVIYGNIIIPMEDVQLLLNFAKEIVRS